MRKKPITGKQHTPSPRLTRKVFVGNRRVEDNLAECVKVAIWNAIGEPSHNVDVMVTGNSARLEGKVATNRQREAAAVAARTLPWITSVDNRLRVGRVPTLERRSIRFDRDQGRPICA